jgi:hypothetical protein
METIEKTPNIAPVGKSRSPCLNHVRNVRMYVLIGIEIRTL